MNHSKHLCWLNAIVQLLRADNNLATFLPKSDDSSVKSTPKVFLPADGATSQMKNMLEANLTKSYSCKAIADAVFEQPPVRSTRQGDYVVAAKTVTAVNATAEPLPKMKLKLDED